MLCVTVGESRFEPPRRQKSAEKMRGSDSPVKENSERAGALYVIASAVLFGLMPLLAKIA